MQYDDDNDVTHNFSHLEPNDSVTTTIDNHTGGIYMFYKRIFIYARLRKASQYIKLIHIPVVPHKAVAEVSRIGNYRRDWLL